MTLSEIVLYFENNIEYFEKSNSKISNATIGWQIDHSLLVINNVCKALIKSNPEEYKWKFNFTRSFLLAINYFPRGKVKAPKVVKPELESPKKEHLIQSISETKSLLKRIETIPKNSHFKHPVFGVLNLVSANKFMKSHSYHHYKIIRDILG